MNLFEADVERTTLPEHYCSCLFKVIANNYERGYNSDPYAICSATVFNRRGIKGPGPVSCKYTREYLNTLPYRYLINYARAKGLINTNETTDIDYLIDIIYKWLHNENKIINRSQENPINYNNQRIISPNRNRKGTYRTSANRIYY